MLVEDAASPATPFLAFALAETIEGSGVLAGVVAGLVLGRRRRSSSRPSSARA